MNCISLWQPWASAIAVGMKTIETRSWPAPKHLIGKPLAIAAAVRDERDQRDFWLHTIRRHPPLYQPFVAAGYRDWMDLPFGQVVCTTKLIASVSTNDQLPPGLAPTTGYDADLGNFAPGRFAWFLQEIVRITQPEPVTGRQGIYQWEPAR